MSCPRCNTYFCWLCLAHLNPRSPYFHFSDPSSKCNLFEGIEQRHGDDSDDSDDSDHNGDSDDSDAEEFDIRFI